MWFKNKEEKQRPEAAKKFWTEEATLDRGVYYLYLIIGLQALFVLTLMGIIMFIGKVIATPAWVFLFMFAASVVSIVYIYRKAKKRLQKLRESFGRSDRNYELSFMGGMLTMKIEQNANGAKLIEAPPAVADEQVIDAETSGPDSGRKSIQSF
ncbi:MAG: hypothetical protein M0Z81_13830 [Deltaproteobacteria bacterium]|jgi:hypothetical protein|nr:hypothetical protein [Deltaproteobacteria bacterium]